MIRILTNLEIGLNYTLTPAGSDYTRKEGSEPAELNGFSSLNVFFAQGCETCRATDTLRDISPPTQTPQISIFLSERLVEVGTVRSLIRGGGWGRGNGGVCVCGVGGVGAQPYLGRSERFPRLLCKGGRT